MTFNEAWMARLKSVECPVMSFGFSRTPFVAFGGDGSYLFDAEGKRYIDGCAGFGALSLGHRPDPAFPATEQGMGDLFPTRAKVELLETLVSVAPPHLRRAALMVSGAQAVEFAIRTARLFTRRERFLVFSNAYHGTDLGVLALSDFPRFAQPFAPRAPFPTMRLPIEADEEQVRDLLKDGSFAGVLVEPVQGRGGLRCIDTSWLHALRTACSEFGSLLMFDEILCGWGRSGRITFANTIPADIAIWGKAMGGGAPIAAVLGRGEVMDAWRDVGDESPYTGTFWGHAGSCRAALDTIRTILALSLDQRAQRLGEAFLAWSTKHCPDGVTACGKGLMVGLRGPSGWGIAMVERCLRRGLVVVPSGLHSEAMVFTPPLNISDSVFDDALAVMASAFIQANI